MWSSCWFLTKFLWNHLWSLMPTWATRQGHMQQKWVTLVVKQCPVMVATPNTQWKYFPGCIWRAQENCRRGGDCRLGGDKYLGFTVTTFHVKKKEGCLYGCILGTPRGLHNTSFISLLLMVGWWWLSYNCRRGGGGHQKVTGLVFWKWILTTLQPATLSNLWCTCGITMVRCTRTCNIG